MSEWWDRYLFDDLIGLEAAAVTSDGSRHIGPFVRFGDYLTVDDTCVFTRKDKGDGVRLMEEVDHVRLRPEEPFWQGRFLDELEGVRVRVEFGGRRGAFEGPLEPFDGVLGIRAVAWNTCSAIPATGSPNRASSGSDLWKTSRTNRCRPSTPPVSSNPGPCCAWPAVSSPRRRACWPNRSPGYRVSAKRMPAEWKPDGMISKTRCLSCAN